MFYHEKLQNDIKDLEERTLKLKEALKKKDFLIPNLLWELKEELKINYKMSAYLYVDNINIYIDPMTPDEFEIFVGTIEEIANSYNFIFDEIDSTERNYYYRDKNDSERYYYIYLNSNDCKYIPTGKLIPETKTDCSLIRV